MAVARAPRKPSAGATACGCPSRFLDELPADEVQRDGADPVADAAQKAERRRAGFANIRPCSPTDAGARRAPGTPRFRRDSRPSSHCACCPPARSGACRCCAGGAPKFRMSATSTTSAPCNTRALSGRIPGRTLLVLDIDDYPADLVPAFAGEATLVLVAPSICAAARQGALPVRRDRSRPLPTIALQARWCPAGSTAGGRSDADLAQEKTRLPSRTPSRTAGPRHLLIYISSRPNTLAATTLSGLRKPPATVGRRAYRLGAGQGSEKLPCGVRRQLGGAGRRRRGSSPTTCMRRCAAIAPRPALHPRRQTPGRFEPAWRPRWLFSQWRQLAGHPAERHCAQKRSAQCNISIKSYSYLIFASPVALTWRTVSLRQPVRRRHTTTAVLRPRPDLKEAGLLFLVDPRLRRRPPLDLRRCHPRRPAPLPAPPRSWPACWARCWRAAASATPRPPRRSRWRLRSGRAGNTPHRCRLLQRDRLLARDGAGPRPTPVPPDCTPGWRAGGPRAAALAAGRTASGRRVCRRCSPPCSKRRAIDADRDLRPPVRADRDIDRPSAPWWCSAANACRRPPTTPLPSAKPWSRRSPRSATGPCRPVVGSGARVADSPRWWPPPRIRHRR